MQRARVVSVVDALAALIRGLQTISHGAQVQNGARPQFEAGSIKRNDGGGSGATISMSPGRLTVVNNPVRNLITNAYEIAPYLVSGGPEWIRSDRYDLEAKAEGVASAPQMRLQ